MVHFTDSDIVLFFMGFFLPPVAVVLKQGFGAEFLISVGLTLLGHVPGILYAWYVIYENRDDPRRPRHTLGRRSYAAVASQPSVPDSTVVVPRELPQQQPPQYSADGHNGNATQQTTMTTNSDPGRTTTTTTTYTTTTTKYLVNPDGTRTVIDRKDVKSTTPPPSN